MNFPQRLSGGKALYEWLNRLLRSVQSDRIVNSATVIVESRTPTGTKLRAVIDGGASGQYREFKLCRNGQQITVEIDSKQDPATVDDDEV